MKHLAPIAQNCLELVRGNFGGDEPSLIVRCQFLTQASPKVALHFQLISPLFPPVLASSIFPCPAFCSKLRSFKFYFRIDSAKILYSTNNSNNKPKTTATTMGVTVPGKKSFVTGGRKSSW